MDNLLNVLNISLGFELIEHFKNDDVTEIMVNSDGEVWIDTFSKGMINTGKKMLDSDSLNIGYLVANSTGTELNSKKPILSSELPGTGFRFQMEIPPVVEHPSFNIRKSAIKIFSLEDYLNSGAMTENQLNIILEAIKNRRNILIIGGTSSGKTTLTNAILKEVAKYNQRVVILEDTKELQSEAKNKVFMRTCDDVSMRDLVKATMRKTPERIIVGEIRDGGTALELLKAWNSGHPGGISTIHADTCIGGLEKLEQYIQEVSLNGQSKLISSGVNLTITIARVGLKRKITAITEILGYKDNDYITKEVK